MKRPVSLTLLLMTTCLITLSGCATVPTQDQIDAADYGSPMVQAEAENLAKQWFANVLKDPESARYQWNKFEKGWAAASLLDGGDHLFGYLLYCKVNAKNSFGGYTGFQNYVFVYKNNQITGVWRQSNQTGSPIMFRVQ